MIFDNVKKETIIDIYDSAESNLEDRWSVAYVVGIDNSRPLPEGEL